MSRPLFHVLIILAILCSTACSRNESNSSGYVTSSIEPDTALVSQLLSKASSFKIELDSLNHYASLAVKVSREVDYSPGLIKSLAVLTDAQRRKGDYAAAVSSCLEYTELADSLGMTVSGIEGRVDLADIYKQMGGEKGTLDYLEKGLALSREAEMMAIKAGDSLNLIESLNEQGIIQRDFTKHTDQKTRYDSALLLYERAIVIAQRIPEGGVQLPKLYNNISQVYNEYYANYSKALEYLFKAVELNTARNSLHSLSYNYGNISEVYLRTGDYPNAKLYAHKMLDASERLKAPHRLINAYSQLTKVSKRLKQYDSALYYRERNMFLGDSLSNVEKTGQIAEMQTRYETEIKEAQITELSHSNKIKNQRMALIGAAACILALVLALLWVQKRKLQKQKEQIVEQSEKLKWLMKELHHRVKNNLQIVSSLLNLQTYRLKDDESVAALRESQLRVQAMSLIHQRLYQVEEVTMVNFKLYISDLTETLMKAYGYNTDSFDLNVNIEKELLDVDTVMPLGLLVNEVITNSFKYAYKDVVRPALAISLEEKSNQIQLSVTDNGPGMNVAEKSNGFGKQLITALTKQLKAKCEIDVSKGTSYLFIIPYIKEKAA
jgi:two-component sensor histidine kinase